MVAETEQDSQSSVFPVRRFKDGRPTIKLRVLLLSCLYLLRLSSPLFAEHFEVTPFFGYRFGGTFQFQPEGQSQQSKLALDDDTSFGVAAGVRFDEYSLIEFRWSGMTTQLRIDAPLIAPAALSGEVRLDQFHGDFTREFPLEDPAVSALRPFLTASLGATRLSNGGASFTRFSFGLGTGLKVFPHSRVGFRVQAQWLPIWVNPEVKAFACGAGGCVVVLGGRLVHQGEISIGPIFRF